MMKQSKSQRDGRTKSDTVVIGGGPAGMMAAIAAAEAGQSVTLLEKNDKLGKKLYITGKGRCNVTNAGDIERHMLNLTANRKFLYSGYHLFDSHRLMAFFEEEGCPLAIERGQRVFPLSNKSSDIIRTLEKALRRWSVRVELLAEVVSLTLDQSDDYEITLKTGQIVKGRRVIIATGGLAYPLTGSTGDGYVWAKQFGHRLQPTVPGLVPLTVEEKDCLKLQGISLRNVQLTLYHKNKVNYQQVGEMLFTHYGVSGPLVLSAASYLPKVIKRNECYFMIDFKPGLTVSQLDSRLLRDFLVAGNKSISNALRQLVPKRLLPILLDRSQIPAHKPVNTVSKQERYRLVSCLKEFNVTIIGRRAYNEAIITRGGIDLKDINPSTMASKKMKNLYFVGEVLDIDALTGGYNLQVAFTTGYCAGCQSVMS